MKKEKLFNKALIKKYKKLVSERKAHLEETGSCPISNDPISVDELKERNYEKKDFKQLEHNYFDFLDTKHCDVFQIDSDNTMYIRIYVVDYRNKATGLSYVCLCFPLPYSIFKLDNTKERKRPVSILISKPIHGSTSIFLWNIKIEALEILYKDPGGSKEEPLNFYLKNVSFSDLDTTINAGVGVGNVRWSKFFQEENFLSLEGDVVFASDNPSLDFKLTRDLYNAAKEKSDFELSSNVYNNLLLKKYKQLKTTNISDKFILWFSNFISGNRTNILMPIGLYIGVILILLFAICVFSLKPDVLILLVPGSLVFNFGQFEDPTILFILSAIMIQILVIILVYEIIVMARKFVEKK